MQRKQSLWLLLAAIAIILTFLMPYGIHSVSAANTTLVTDTDLTAKSNWILALLAGACAALAMFTIFLHQNRSLQKRMTLLLVLVSLLCGVYMIYDANLTTAGNKLVVGVLGSGLYLGVLFPIISAGLAIMAYMGIRKDEKLIASMDRLR
ncbi:MAG: DUF4293 family protein [Chitinophagaceae bacterium]|nr:DUF4293 family protein [Chitinophagaceae bacterium]